MVVMATLDPLPLVASERVKPPLRLSLDGNVRRGRHQCQLPATATSISRVVSIDALNNKHQYHC